nr:ParM/StbA family protein [uncultured Schaedlerella sp.]
MEMSVFELLAIARESAGADYVKGDRILCGKRYAADTEHMLEFRVLSGQEPHVVFPSGLAVYDYEPYTTQNVLQYGGKYYVCGTGRQALMKDKTANDNYYLLTMAALAQEIRHRKAEKQLEVVLAAGLPLSGFGREKQAFYHYLLRDHQPLCFQYDDEKYRLWIRDVKLFPQGYSAIALHPEFVDGEPSVLLADIGGWMVDLMRLDNVVPNAATCRSLELGVIRCMDEVREQIRRRMGLSVTDSQIERVLNGSTCSMDETAKEMICQHGRLYTERILSSILEAGFDFKAIPVVFLGGGASIMERNIKPQDGLCRGVFLTDVHANAAGYERIAGEMMKP